MYCVEGSCGKYFLDEKASNYEGSLSCFMLDTFRMPFFVIGLVLIICVVLIEIGSSVFLGSASATPGFAISYLALLDGLLLLTTLLFAAPLLISEQLHGKIQGILVLFISLFLLITTIMMIMAAFVALMIMIVLLTSPIFGTIAYFAIFGKFAGGASITLSLIMSLKLAFVWFLFLAHQRFLQNKGLVLIVLTSLLATIVISFFHGFPPGFLVSITDVIGAIIVAILAVIWGMYFLVSSIISMVKAI